MLRSALPLVALSFAVVAAPSVGADAPNAKTHWAFKAPVRPDAPATKHTARNAIDKFIPSRSNATIKQDSPLVRRLGLLR